ncbi:MAG: hypothetical protein JJU11_07840, partial [Candidatus Sumerlaeia bacterium]|nr:hypothetical protein [Candidatus Sumerlaeia bacterium]
MPDHDLHLLPRGTATCAEGWAAVWYRCGFTLQNEGVKQPHLTLLHGEGDSPPEGIPSLVVKSSPTGTPESWRAHFSPLLEDYSRDAASFLNRHMERRTDTIWALDFDVAAFAEGILKGWHEQADSLDGHGRVIPDASLLARHNLLDRPVLDEICHQFSRIISDLTSVK